MEGKKLHNSTITEIVFLKITIMCLLLEFKNIYSTQKFISLCYAMAWRGVMNDMEMMFMYIAISEM